MPKCDFNKVAKQLYSNHIQNGCSPVNLLHIFRTPFPRNTSEWLLLNIEDQIVNNDVKITYIFLKFFSNAVKNLEIPELYGTIIL